MPACANAWNLERSFKPHSRDGPMRLNQFFSGSNLDLAQSGPDKKAYKVKGIDVGGYARFVRRIGIYKGEKISMGWNAKTISAWVIAARRTRRWCRTRIKVLEVLFCKVSGKDLKPLYR